MSSDELTAADNILIAAGEAHTCRVTSDRVECWGRNRFGQLGNGEFLRDPVHNFTMTPQRVKNLSGGVTAISAGDEHTCVVHNGAAKCWGLNDLGELGNDEEGSSNVPVQVVGLSRGVTAISAGREYTCAVHNGAAKCWGRDGGDHNLLGISPMNDGFSTTPVTVLGLNSGVTAIAAGGTMTCAIHNGAVKCWGKGYGWNSNTGAVQIGNLSSGATKVLVGEDHACALVSGELWCWGENALGQLGDGSTGSNPFPQKVFGLNDKVSDFSLGYYFSCAIFDKITKCWGNNSAGQLGDDSTTNSPIPVTVKRLMNNVTNLSAGGYHGCAIDGGQTWCWGANGSKQLGR